MEWADGSASWNIQGSRYLTSTHPAIVAFDSRFHGMDTHDNTDSSIMLTVKKSMFQFIRLAPNDTGSQPIPMNQLTVPPVQQIYSDMITDLTGMRDAKSAATTSTNIIGPSPRDRWIHARTASFTELKNNTTADPKTLMCFIFWGLTEPTDMGYVLTISILIQNLVRWDITPAPKLPTLFSSTPVPLSLTVSFQIISNCVHVYVV